MALGITLPLAAIGALCESRALWLHVDGAHGASALLSPGTAPAPQGSASSVRGEFAFSTNGAREDFNNYVLDGGDNFGHVVDVWAGTLLYKISGRQKLKVNTTHHQAIRKLGKGLAINATAPDGLIEGIESKKHSFVLGLQWHPEVLARSEAVQRRIFLSFVLACSRLHCRT